MAAHSRKSQGQTCLAGYSSWGRRELDTAERLSMTRKLKLHMWLTFVVYILFLIWLVAKKKSIAASARGRASGEREMWEKCCGIPALHSLTGLGRRSLHCSCGGRTWGKAGRTQGKANQEATTTSALLNKHVGTEDSIRQRWACPELFTSEVLGPAWAASFGMKW